MSHQKMERKPPVETVEGTLNFLTAISGIESAFVVSEEGFPMFVSCREPYNQDDELLVSAMIASIVATVSSATTKLGRKETEHITIETPDGYIIISSINKAAILALKTNKNLKLGMAYYSMRQAQDKIQKGL
ncbi:MAG: roadblock/LC7 domain-containing protein [Candidatus Hermodarchaeota archaeon]